MFKVSCDEAIWQQCGLCSESYLVPDGYIKMVMGKCVPSHALTLENKCCKKKYVLTHQPCAAGCYECVKSELALVAL